MKLNTHFFMQVYPPFTSLWHATHLKSPCKHCSTCSQSQSQKDMVNDTQQPASDISNADTSSDLVHGVNIGSNPPSDSEICSWDGGVNHYPSDVEETTHGNSDSEEEGFSDLEGDELLQSLQKAQQKELEKTWKCQQAHCILTKCHKTLPRKAESNQHLGYSKGSMWTQCRHDLEAHQKEKKDSVAGRGEYIWNLIILIFCGYLFAVKSADMIVRVFPARVVTNICALVSAFTFAALHLLLLLLCSSEISEGIRLRLHRCSMAGSKGLLSLVRRVQGGQRWTGAGDLITILAGKTLTSCLHFYCKKVTTKYHIIKFQMYSPLPATESFFSFWWASRSWRHCVHMDPLLYPKCCCSQPSEVRFCDILSNAVGLLTFSSFSNSFLLCFLQTLQQFITFQVGKSFLLRITIPVSCFLHIRRIMINTTIQEHISLSEGGFEPILTPCNRSEDVSAFDMSEAGCCVSLTMFFLAFGFASTCCSVYKEIWGVWHVTGCKWGGKPAMKKWVFNFISNPQMNRIYSWWLLNKYYYLLPNFKIFAPVGHCPNVVIWIRSSRGDHIDQQVHTSSIEFGKVVADSGLGQALQSLIDLSLKL